MDFDKNLTNSVKGIAIVLMLIHHLFAPTILEEGIVDTIPFSCELFSWFCNQLKICVGIFVFLTAFGITRWLNKVKPKRDRLFWYSLSRCFKLECNFFVVYILGVFGNILCGKGILKIYNINSNYFMAVVYALIDATGLSTQFGTPSLNVTWWYMSIAYLMIFLIPVLVMIYKRIGKMLPVISFFVSIPAPHLNPYFFALVMGICTAEEHLFERAYNKFAKNQMGWKKNIRGLEILLCIFAVLLLIYLRKQTNLTYYIDGIIPLFICYACMILKDRLNLFYSVLEFIGKYSMNIFFIHTFIYLYLFHDYIYWTRNWMLILATLLIVCMMFSIVIEFIKKKTGFYDFLGNLSNKIEKGGRRLYE